jgi:hypothetical protein
MTRTLVTAIVLLAILFGVPCPAAAQVPVRSFDQLNTRLKPGDTVYVTDAQGRQIIGKLRELGPSGILVDDGGPQTLGPQDVRLIEERSADSNKNGAILGLLIGAGGGVAIGAWMYQTNGFSTGDFWPDALIYGGIGAGVGAALGVMFDGMVRSGPKRVVFRAAAPAGPGSARLSFAPVITPRAKGVVVAFSF